MSKKNKKRRGGFLQKLLPDELTVRSAVWGFVWMFVAGLLTTMLSDFFVQCKIVMLSSSARLCDKIVDSFYEMMARSSVLDSIFEAALTWKLMGFIFVTYTAAYALGRAKGIENGVVEMRKRNGKSAEELEKFKGEKDLREWARRKERMSRTFSMLGRTQFVIGVVYALMLVFHVGLGLFINERTKAFKRDLVIVRPLIPDLDYYTLERDWVLIKTKSDYCALQDKINRLKGSAENASWK